MRIILIILMAFAVLISSNANSDSMKSGTYNNLQAEKLGKVGKLLLHPEGENHFLFSLKLNKGKPSYNSGHLYGKLHFNGDVAIFENSEYKFKDKICILKFENKNNVISISTIDSNNQCGFGFGVFADGEYQRTSIEVPESYIDALGDTVPFP